MKEITRERVLELFDYDRVVGEFIRRATCGKAKAGDIAGYISWNGYRIICVDYVDYFGHNLVWLMENGEFPGPGMEIDHRNRRRAENWFDNLRIGTRSQNNANMKIRSDNSTGERGVYRDASRNLFCVQMTAHGKTRSLGRYSTVEEAGRVARAARLAQWGEFASQDRSV